MIVESSSYSALSNKLSQSLATNRWHMAMSKLTLKQNGHSKTNENRADDDYGGGGGEPESQCAGQR